MMLEMLKVVLNKLKTIEEQIIELDKKVTNGLSEKGPGTSKEDRDTR